MGTIERIHYSIIDFRWGNNKDYARLVQIWRGFVPAQRCCCGRHAKDLSKEGAESNTAHVFVKTASPVKFGNVVNDTLGEEITEEQKVDWDFQKPVCIIPHDLELYKRLIKERFPPPKALA